MRKELEDIQLIEAYLMNQLSTEEQESFEQRLESNDSFRKEVEIQKTFIEAIERMGLKKDIKKAEKRFFNTNGIYFSAGFIFLIILSSFYYFSNQDSVKSSQYEIRSTVIELSNISENKEKEIVEKEKKAESEVLKLDQSAKKVIVYKELKIPSEAIQQTELIFQYFTINNHRDTILRGKEGTVLKIAANSFQSRNEKVRIGLKEYYKLSDIVFSDLSTVTTEGELLETGGMLFIEARSMEGEKLELEKEMGLKFPTIEKKKGMQLFDGVRERNNIQWKLQKAVSEEASIDKIQEEKEADELEFTETFTIVENMPSYPDCKSSSRLERDYCTEQAVLEFVKNNIKIPIEAKDLAFRKKVIISYLIDERGFVRNAKIGRGVHPLLDTAALNAVKALPRFTPGNQRGRNVPIRLSLPIKFNLHHDHKYYTASEIDRYNDSIQRIRRKERFMKIENKLDSIVESDAMPTQEILNEVQYYVFSTSELGYINCDRFPRVGDRMNYELTDLPLGSEVKLIFHRIKSILRASLEDTQYVFKKVPKGEKVSLFIIQQIDGEPYICLQEVKLSDGLPIIELEKVTQENLKVYKERINGI